MRIVARFTGDGADTLVLSDHAIAISDRPRGRGGIDERSSGAADCLLPRGFSVTDSATQRGRLAQQDNQSKLDRPTY